MRDRPCCRWVISFIFLGLLSPGVLQAVEKIRVVALFADKAMVEVDGKRRFLTAGEVSPEGVLLVSATAEEATLEIDGRQERYQLGSVAGGHFAQRELAEARIFRDAQGVFMTVADAIRKPRNGH